MLRKILPKIAIMTLATLAISAAAIQSNAQAAAAISPAAEVRQNRSWELGPFVNGGTGLIDRTDYQFLSLGFQAGKTLTPILHAGPLTGQFEFGANIMPLWQAYTPDPHTIIATSGGVNYTEQVGGGTFTGFSITPVIFRWNLATPTRRFTPWLQAAGGFIYTDHKFPPSIEVPKGTPGGTSVFNFSPQGGVGFHYFTKPRHSIDFGVNAVHISSASLGDKNPGVNASLQVQVGYSWWK
jgi:lipid A 3-O-deacylase